MRSILSNSHRGIRSAHVSLSQRASNSLGLATTASKAGIPYLPHAAWPSTSCATRCCAHPTVVRMGGVAGPVATASLPRAAPACHLSAASPFLLSRRSPYSPQPPALLRPRSALPHHPGSSIPANPLQHVKLLDQPPPPPLAISDRAQPFPSS